MAISTRENSTRGSPMETEFTRTWSTAVTRGIGWTGVTTGMELRAGRGEANTVDSTGKDSDTVSDFTGSTPEILTPASGVMDSIMELGCKVAPMEVAMLASSSVVSNTDLAATISGSLSSFFINKFETQSQSFVSLICN